jgi:hypothetical protein
MMIIMPLSTIGGFLIGLVYDDNNATFNNRWISHRNIA